MRLKPETVDMFTSKQLSGNPLAVVLNAEGLSTAQAGAGHRRGIQSLRKTVAQGVGRGCPSLLHGEALTGSGLVTATFIGCRCMPVMTGTIEVS